MAPTGAPHLADGDLVRVIDGEGTPALGAHIAACSSCSTRLEDMRGRLAQLSDLLEETDVAPPSALHVPDASTLRRRQTRTVYSRYWRIAAGLLLVVGVAVSPLGAWVATRLGRLTSSTRESTVEPPASPDAVRVPAPTIVYFQPAGADFTIRFEARPSAGNLSIERDTRASAEIVGTRSSESLLVLPSELRIRNSARSSADYRLAFPVSVRSLRIRFEGEPASGDVVLDLSSSPRHTVALAKRP